MDFLRRLHPSAAAGRGAARLVPGALRAVPTTPTDEGRGPTPSPWSPTTSTPAPAPTGAADRLAVEPPADSIPLDAAPSPAAAPALADRPTVPAPAPAPAVGPSRSMAPGRGLVATEPSAAGPAYPTHTAASAPDQGEGGTAADAASGSPPAARSAGWSVAAEAGGVTLPLRSVVVREAARPATPAPVVHVTIDRIDVRLPPSPAAASRATARARPSSAQPALGDYLRGRAGGSG